MSRKRILLVSSISLFPIKMASQDRVFKLIQRLSKDHDVDVISLVNSQEAESLMKSKLELSGNYYPIKAINHLSYKWRRIAHALLFRLKHKLTQIPREIYYYQHSSLKKSFSNILNNKYDIVIAQYWFMSFVFDLGNDNKLKVVDTHDIVHHKKKQLLAKGGELSHANQKILSRFIKEELHALNKADLLVSITPDDERDFNELFPQKEKIVIATGQDIEEFKSYPKKQENNSIAFYGGMGSESNIEGFYRTYEKILPLIKKAIPDVKLYVIGSNPPESIKKLDDDKSIIVTGFVDDVKEYLAKTKIIVLPLNVAAGFRSRTVEVMAMGLPVVGTPMALDNILMENGVHGFIANEDEKIAEHIIELLKDEALYQRMSNKAIEFVESKYSIESTYGKLSKYFSDLSL